MTTKEKAKSIKCYCKARLADDRCNYDCPLTNRKICWSQGSIPDEEFEQLINENYEILFGKNGEHDGCVDCKYEDVSEYSEPCIRCKGTAAPHTTQYKTRPDLYERKEEPTADDLITAETMVNMIRDYCEVIHCGCKECAIKKQCDCICVSWYEDSINLKEAFDILMNLQKDDPVNHPSHYTKGKIEVADFIADQKLNFDRGNAVKYLCRAGSKDPEKEIQDLEKAIWYINHEIKTLKGE